jgi:hypothetical protein
MSLSKNLKQLLRQVFGEQARPSKPSPLDRMDKWHCAGYGVPLVDDAGIGRCPDGGHTMGEFAYELIEFHPHGPFPPNQR